GGVGAATQHPIGSALVTRAFSGARALKAFGAYNFAGDVGKVLLPATATSLLLILPWRPAYTLLGLAGIVAAMLIAVLPLRSRRSRTRPPPSLPSASAAKAILRGSSAFAFLSCSASQTASCEAAFLCASHSC